VKRRRLVCFLILVIILFTNTVSVFADVDLSPIVDFNTLTEIIKLRQSSFSSKGDVRFFWQIYLKDIYPECSRRNFQY